MPGQDFCLFDKCVSAVFCGQSRGTVATCMEMSEKVPRPINDKSRSTEIVCVSVLPNCIIAFAE